MSLEFLFSNNIQIINLKIAGIAILSGGIGTTVQYDD